MSGNFLSCIGGVKDPLSRKREGGISLSTPQQKRASSRVKGRISWLFSSYGRKLGVPLDLRWGSQGPAGVASGKSSLHACCEGPLGIPLQSVQGPRASSRVEARTSGILSRVDMDLGFPMAFQQESQASTHVETWNSPFLSRGKTRVRLPVELT